VAASRLLGRCFLTTLAAIDFLPLAVSINCAIPCPGTLLMMVVVKLNAKVAAMHLA